MRIRTPSIFLYLQFVVEYCPHCGQYSTTNCRCDVSALDLRRSMRRLSKIDVSPFEDRCHHRYLAISFINDVTMCRPSEIDVSTFGDRCVDL